MLGQIVVLTGAAGCLGFHTLRLLVKHDDAVEEIRCLDLKIPQESMKVRLEAELKASKTTKRITWIKGDIRDINVVEQTMDNADCVFHCAALLDWSADEQDKSEIESVNVRGTENLLKAAIRCGVSKFIHISSFEVYLNHDTIYYATENTLPETNWLFFGTSAWSKREAETKVKQYSNNKLLKPSRLDGKDTLQAVILRFPIFYGEFDKYYVSRVMEVSKFFGGKLQRFSNIWIKQQPIYVGNAAWALLKAKNRLDHDSSISGEGKLSKNMRRFAFYRLIGSITILNRHSFKLEFHITDDTPIQDTYDFLEPFLKSRGMRVTKKAYPYIPTLLLLLLLFNLAKLFKSLDVFGLFSDKGERLKDAMNADKSKGDSKNDLDCKRGRKHWYHYLTPQFLGLLCSSTFLNRTKASLRLDYEPLYSYEKSQQLSIDWYKNEENT